MRRVVSVWLRQFKTDLQTACLNRTGNDTEKGIRPPDEAASLHKLVLWCLRYAPLVAPDPPDGLWIDITGCAHLMGGEATLCTDLLAGLERRGFAARLGLADTPGAAYALARHGAGRVVIAPLGTHGSALAMLPVAALRLADDMIDALHRLGFAKIGSVVAAPRAPLMRRFGGILLQRLDQALGSLFESINPILPEAVIGERLAFIEPLITPKAFRLVIERLTQVVVLALDKAGLGARRLDLIFERIDSTTQLICIGTARPSRDAEHLTRLLVEHLETIDPGPGVEAMRLAVTLAEPLAYVQAAVWPDGAGNVVNLAALIDRLENRLGRDRLGLPRLYRFAPVESDVPERAVQRIPPLAPARQKSWSATLPRPSRLLTPPQPVMALAPLPDQPPVAFTWRQTRFRVRRADGPERIHGEWWRRDAEACAVRDYFQVEDETGRRFWLFRRGDGVDPATGDLSWFLHGFF